MGTSPKAIPLPTRFRSGFDTLADMNRLEPLAEEYFVPPNAPSTTTEARPLPAVGKADAGFLADHRGASAIAELCSDDRSNGLDKVEARQLGVAGWVARLFSGMGHLEVQSTDGADSHYLPGAEAILSTLRRLDASLSGASTAAATALREDTLHRQVSSRATAPRRRREGLDRGGRGGAAPRLPLGTDKTTEPPSGDRHEYWHPAPYWWPNPATADGLPYVWRYGERAPGPADVRA